MSKIFFTTPEELLAAEKELLDKGYAIRSEGNPEKAEYWLDIKYIPGEIVRERLAIWVSNGN